MNYKKNQERVIHLTPETRLNVVFSGIGRHRINYKQRLTTSVPFINKRAPKHSRIRPFRNRDATTAYTGRSRVQSVSAFRFRRAVHRSETAAGKCAATARHANAKKCKKFERRAWKASDDVMPRVIPFSSRWPPRPGQMPKLLDIFSSGRLHSWESKLRHSS